MRRVLIQIVLGSLGTSWAGCADCPGADRAHRSGDSRRATRPSGRPPRGPDQRVPVLPHSGPLAQRVLHDQGRSLLLAGRPREAGSVLQRAIDADPRGSLVPQCYLGLGTALAQQGELERAVEAYRQLVILRPGDAEARRALALGLEQAGQPDAARRELQHALRLEGDLLLAYQDLAALLLAQGQRDAARAVYRRYEGRRRALTETAVRGATTDERLRALQRLAEARDEQTARWLVDQLQLAKGQQQRAVIVALGQQRQQLAVGPLRALLARTSDGETRRAIEISLRKIAAGPRDGPRVNVSSGNVSRSDRPRANVSSDAGPLR